MFFKNLNRIFKSLLTSGVCCDILQINKDFGDINMVKFIEKATKEFNENGRSDLFVGMENKIIKGGKPIQIYFFARFAKGASVRRMQNAMLKYATLEDCYFFQKYVPGAKIELFVDKAIKQSDVFWVKKFTSLAKINGTYSKISSQVAEFEQIKQPGILSRTAFDINEIIAEATKEVEKYHKRTAYFIELEKYALYSNIDSDAKLFVFRVPGASLKRFNHVAFMKCDPFELCYNATQIKDSDAELMYRGLELARLDYRTIEPCSKDLEIKRENILKKLAYYKKHCDEVEYKRWYDAYRNLPVMPEYLAQIENNYMPAVKYVLRSQGKLK